MVAVETRSRASSPKDALTQHASWWNVAFQVGCRAAHSMGSRRKIGMGLLSGSGFVMIAGGGYQLAASQASVGGIGRSVGLGSESLQTAARSIGPESEVEPTSSAVFPLGGYAPTAVIWGA